MRLLWKDKGLPRSIEPSPSDVDPSLAPFTARDQRVRELYRFLLNKRVAHFIAPPFSGKSSLAILLGRHMVSNGWKAFYLPSINQEHNWQTLFKTECGMTYEEIVVSSARTIVIIDDAHDWFAPEYEEFWKKIKSHENFSQSNAVFLFVSTYRKIYAGSSRYKSKSRVPADMVFASENEMNELIFDFKSVSQLSMTPLLEQAIKNACGNHLGILRSTLYTMYERLRTAPNFEEAAVKFLLDEQLHNVISGSRIVFHPNKLLSKERAILCDALNGPVNLPEDDFDEDIEAAETLSIAKSEDNEAPNTLSVTSKSRDRFQGGYEIPPHDHLIGIGILKKIQSRDVDGKPTGLAFADYASPLIRRVVFNHMYAAITRPLTPPSSLYDFVKQAIQLMNVRNTFIYGQFCFC